MPRSPFAPPSAATQVGRETRLLSLGGTRLLSLGGTRLLSLGGRICRELILFSRLGILHALQTKIKKGSCSCVDRKGAHGGGRIAASLSLCQTGRARKVGHPDLERGRVDRSGEVGVFAGDRDLDLEPRPRCDTGRDGPVIMTHGCVQLPREALLTLVM